MVFSEFRSVTAQSHTSRIWIAGDYDDARRAVRAFCSGRGFCATVQRADYIYTGGEEAGVVIGIINYPRFPRTPDELLSAANELAMHVCLALHQSSYTVEGPEVTVWFTRRNPGDNHE